jgi:recombinational DNA repair protein (RecF pathway)
MCYEKMKEECPYCFEKLNNCVCHFNTCYVCKKLVPDSLAYEYRGAICCEECFDEGTKKRDFERQEIMTEEQHKLKPLEGLSFGDSVIGRANREIMKPQIEIARKESGRIKSYENRK